MTSAHEARRRVLIGSGLAAASFVLPQMTAQAAETDIGVNQMNSAKPSIVFCHGIRAEGSCFQKLIPTLRAEGHEVMAAQYGLDTLKGDVDAAIRTF